MDVPMDLLLDLRRRILHARDFHKKRDEMNAVLHLSDVKYSPLTAELDEAAQTLYQLLVDGGFNW